MKKVFLLMAVLALILASCAKEDSNTKSVTEDISVSALPSSISLYVSENYPDASISSTTKTSSTYNVILSTSEQLSFDSNGNFINEKELAILCDSTDSHSGHGHHGGGPHHHGDGHHKGGIYVDSLPSGVSDYVLGNYSGYTIHDAQYDSLCQFGKVINVMIDSSKVLHHKLIFNTTGAFLALAHRIDSTSIPVAIISTLTSSYPTYTLRKRAERLTLDDASLQYRIFLHQDTIKLCVAMHDDGSIICEQ